MTRVTHCSLLERTTGHLTSWSNHTWTFIVCSTSCYMEGFSYCKDSVNHSKKVEKTRLQFLTDKTHPTLPTPHHIRRSFCVVKALWRAGSHHAFPRQKTRMLSRLQQTPSNPCPKGVCIPAHSPVQELCSRLYLKHKAIATTAHLHN